MQKAKLTTENIKADLAFRIKECYKETAYYFVGFVAVALIMTLIFSLGGIIPLDSIVKVLLTFVGETLVLIKMAVLLLHVKTIKDTMKSLNFIESDTLVCLEIKEGHKKFFAASPLSTRTYYIFNFSKCGEYILPYEVYIWSQTFRMSGKGIFDQSMEGDEFYLVISNSPKKEILCAYSKKFFEL